jgi:DNA-binding NarL/FixJ family response regulator
MVEVITRPATVLLVADDMVRIGLRTVLENEGFRIQAESRSLDQAGSVESVDLVVTVCNSGEQKDLDLVRGIRESWPSCKIAVLASKVEARGFLSLVMEGVSGYFRRDVPLPRLLDSLSMLCGGDLLIVGPLALEDLKREFPHVQRLLPATAVKDISEEDLAIMELLQKGHALNEIATTLHASKRTLERRTKRLYEKLETRGPFGAGVRAAKVRPNLARIYRSTMSAKCVRRWKAR